MSAAITIWQSGQGSVGDNRGDPAWNNVLSFVTIGFMSVSMGLQGIMGKRLNTQFTTTGTYSVTLHAHDGLTDGLQSSSPRRGANS